MLTKATTETMQQDDTDMKQSAAFRAATSNDNDGTALRRTGVENERQGMIAGADNAADRSAGENHNRSEAAPTGVGTLTEVTQDQNRGDQITSGNGLTLLSATIADPQATRSRQTPTGRRRTFPLRLHTLLSDVEAQGQTDIISWQPHGKCFVVRNIGGVSKTLAKVLQSEQMVVISEAIELVRISETDNWA